MATTDEQNPEGLETAVSTLKTNVAELASRLEAVENKTPPDVSVITDAVQAVHLAVFGVPAGELQSLTDKK